MSRARLTTERARAILAMLFLGSVAAGCAAAVAVWLAELYRFAVLAP